jgi:hypothetical protein
VAVDFLDEWAAGVNSAHINTGRFPVNVVAELTVGEKDRSFGAVGGPRSIGFECDRLMRERARYWAELSQRFKAHPHSTGARNVELTTHAG